MKLLLALSLPFLFASCELTPIEAKNAPEPQVEKIPEPEIPEEETIEEPEAGLELIDPVITDRLLSDEDKKTVAGPVPVNVPEPAEDSAIDVEPSIPTPPSED